jgi:hypothetical protein
MIKALKALLLALLILAAVPSIAEAARRKKKNVTPPPTEASLPVPQSDLPLATYLPPVVESKPTTLEVGLSTWAPDKFSRGTRNVGDREFERGSVPMISLNRMAFIDDRLKGLYSKFGLSAATLERTAQVSRPGGSVSEDQKLSLFSARVGVEYRTRKYSGDLLQPFASLAALPTMGLASRSAFEDTVTTDGVPFELALGTEVAPSFLPTESLGVQRSSIGLGLQYLFGSVGGSRADGLGVQGSLRVDL